jgi:hypothetical protein
MIAEKRMTVAELRAYVEKGLSDVKIAELYEGITYRNVRAMRDKHHIPGNMANGKPAMHWTKYRERYNLNYPKAVRLQRAGQTCAAIAEVTGVPVKTVERWLASGETFFTRPLKTERKTPRVRCDCGEWATHFGVELSVGMGSGRNTASEKYDLCEDCYQLENEPINAKGAAVWNR